MPRTRRYIKSNGLYEITFRASSTLPLPCTEAMAAVIHSALARVQRDNKVVLHHYIFEGTHPHILCTAKDADKCRQFYGQLQKQLTESIKRFLGLEQLNIWDGCPSVIEIPTLEDAISTIAYLYANPSNDDLERSIELYPGVSSWQALRSCDSVEQRISVKHPRIRQFMIPKLPSAALTPRQDRFVTEKILERSKESHELQVYPLLWIKHFIDDPSRKDVSQFKEEIIADLRSREEENGRRRVRERKTVLGAKALRLQALLKPHTPKKKGRKIFVKTRFKEIRQKIIAERRQIELLCREAYESWKVRDFRIPWPPGTFPPALPPPANALCW